VPAGPIEPVWIDNRLALAVHDRQLAEHGGGTGVRDPSALESALARPRNRWAYGQTDLCRLAAAYAFGIARNHPFVDGNKRTAWVTARSFLILNDLELTYAREDAVRIVEQLAVGQLSEDGLADWFHECTV
jgi:death-on-curing protein